MTPDPESLVATAIEVYGDYFNDIQTLADLLHLAERHPENQDQITLLKTAIQIATGVGSFSRNLPEKGGNWLTRQ